MRILVTNDDGIDAQGIQVLAESLKEVGEVIVVAPLKEQSAVGHGITMMIPLRIIEYKKNGKLFGYAINGTPADCVKIGVRNIMQTPPDLVVSGINHGANTAINIIYSGTVSAAREAAIMDIPSIAISITNHLPQNFEYAGKVAKMIAKKMQGRDLPLGTLLNVNIPDLPEEEIAGIHLTRQGKSKWDDNYEQRKDPYGRDYYWLIGNLNEIDTEVETDHIAVRRNFVSITPIHFDLTDYVTYERMRNWNIERLMDEEES